MEKKFAENDYIMLYTEGNILYSEYKPGTTIHLAAAMEIMDLISSLCKNDRYLVLQDMNQLEWIDKQSRDYLASHPATSQMHAWAYHAQKPLHNVMYSIYVTFSKPEVSTEFFHDAREALKWLQGFAEKQ